MKPFLKKCWIFILSVALSLTPVEARVGRASKAAFTATNHVAWITGVTAAMALVMITTVAVTSTNADAKK